jgi:hypothetical protein
MTDTDHLAADVLEGADQIAKHIYGPAAHARRGRTTIRRGLPIFRLGRRVYARKSTIAEWISRQESVGAAHEYRANRAQTRRQKGQPR